MSEVCVEEKVSEKEECLPRRVGEEKGRRTRRERQRTRERERTNSRRTRGRRPPGRAPRPHVRRQIFRRRAQSRRGARRPGSAHRNRVRCSKSRTFRATFARPVADFCRCLFGFFGGVSSPPNQHIVPQKKVVPKK